MTAMTTVPAMSDMTEEMHRDKGDEDQHPEPVCRNHAMTFLLSFARLFGPARVVVFFAYCLATFQPTFCRRQYSVGRLPHDPRFFRFSTLRWASAVTFATRFA